jgi:osmotically-inducible protein OsmY
MKSDQRLQHEVVHAVKREPLLMGLSSALYAELGVTASNGVITLTGHVDSYPKKWAVEHAAKSVHGVRAIAEEIEVPIDRTNRISDTQIAQSAVWALRESDAVPDDRITISVENGCVKLEGNVEWPFEKDEAGRVIEDLDGVMKITNLITVQPDLKYVERKEHFRHSLQHAFSMAWNFLSIS